MNINTDILRDITSFLADDRRFSCQIAELDKVIEYFDKKQSVKNLPTADQIWSIIDNDFLVAIGDSNDFNFIEYPVYTSRIDEKDKTVDNDKNQIYETSVMPSRIDGEKENKDKNSVYPSRTDVLYTSRTEK